MYWRFIRQRHGCIITPEFWHLNWPHEGVDIQFLGIGTLSQVKQSTQWVECIGLEGQIGRLRPYISNIAVYLWGLDILQQWNTQISISPAPQNLCFQDNI